MALYHKFYVITLHCPTIHTIRDEPVGYNLTKTTNRNWKEDTWIFSFYIQKNCLTHFLLKFKTLRLYMNLNVTYAIFLTFDNEPTGFMEPWCV